MNTEQIKKFKAKLEEECLLLVGELKSIGRVNPDNPLDWEPTPPEADDETKSDTNDEGTRLEEYEDHAAILKPLEVRYNEVKKALGKINSEKGFGICEVCGKPIELDRLEANPAAATCKEHMR